MKKDIYIGVIGIIATLASANFAVYLQTQQTHNQVIKNINVQNCINRLLVGMALNKTKDQYGADWNIRYLTDFYDLVWADLVQEFETSTLKYVSVVGSMKNVNTLLDRVDRFRPQGVDRSTAFQDVATGVDGVNSTLDSLNVNNETCNRLVGENPK